MIICSNRWKRSNNPTLGGVSSTPLPSSKFQWKTVPSLRTPPTRKGVHRETKVLMRKSTCPKNAVDVFYVVKTEFCPLLELILTKFLQPHLLLPLASASRYKSRSPAKAQMRTLLAMVREGSAGEKGKTTAKLYCTQRSMSNLFSPFQLWLGLGESEGVATTPFRICLKKPTHCLSHLKTSALFQSPVAKRRTSILDFRAATKPLAVPVLVSIEKFYLMACCNIHQPWLRLSSL